MDALAPEIAPVTVAEPLTPMFGILTSLLNVQSSFVPEYNIVAFAPATVKPAPLAVAESIAPDARVMFTSAVDNVVELTVVLVP